MQIETTRPSVPRSLPHLSSTRWRSSLAAGVLLTALGCGSSAPVRPEAHASESTTGSEPVQQRTPPPSASSFEMNPHAEAELTLGDRAEVPGTGVSLRAPVGSRRATVGAGFVHPRGHFRIIVAAVNGDEDLLRLFVESLREGTVVSETEDLSINGHPARLVVDTQPDGSVELERVWAFFRDGDHAMAVVGAYPSNRSDRLRGVVREAVLSTEWDPNVTIEPERAAGFHLTPPAGLAPAPQVVSTVTYVEPGSELSPESGRPTLLVVPLPIDVPETERDAACGEILHAIGPVEEERVTSRADIATENVRGCEVFGSETITEPTEGGPTELATYAAIVFLGDSSYLVAGCVDAANREAWSPRFSEATRTVQAVPR
jgi:hypothetical protein